MEKSMCGICGFFGKKKNKREIVEKMKEKLVHRGPDAQGSFVNDSVALGFRRLSIIDLEGGLQPMKSSSQNLTVVFNGEIYNYQELREQMEREKKILFVWNIQPAAWRLLLFLYNWTNIPVFQVEPE